MTPTWLLWLNLICAFATWMGSLYRIHQCISHEPPLKKALVFYVVLMIFGAAFTGHFYIQVAR